MSYRTTQMKKLLMVLGLLLLQFQFIFAQQAQTTKTLKVLAIGNSFSEDAVENYLYDLAKAAGKSVIIGNMYIGGCPLERHARNADSNKQAYSYRKIHENGIKRVRKQVSLEEAIADEDWDYISLQQASPLSGKYDIIMKDLPFLVDYVKTRAPQARLIYHQTWAYQQDAKHTGFANYNRQQSTMYQKIRDVTRKLDRSGRFAFIVPAGTAVQNGRSSSIGDHYTRDGYHLQLDYGRFTVACTWFEKLFGIDVRKNSYRPEKVSEKESRISKAAAHKAVRRPFKVSRVRI
ncbi:DUF4886 domain-containing protein [Niabella terrae]